MNRLKKDHGGEMNEEIKKRAARFYVILPLMIVPCLTFVFWVLDGGKKIEATDTRKEGLLTQVPAVPEGELDVHSKLESYQQADRDSLKWLELAEMDPSISSNDHLGIREELDYQNALNSNVYREPDQTDQQTDELLDRLGRLQEQLSEGTVQESEIYPSTSRVPATADADLQRLEELMGTLAAPQREDPETAQLNAMLEKILDIQHPQRMNRKLDDRRMHKFSAIYPVQASHRQIEHHPLDVDKVGLAPVNEFFGLQDAPHFESAGNAIRAVVHSDQTLLNGSVVKLRLQEAIRVGNVEIPKDSFVFGLAQLQDERLEIEINTIRLETNIVPVSLTVFDMDGLPGIHIPGAITRDATQHSADQTLQMMRLSSLDASLAGQAASAGVEAAKNLMGRKVRLTKVKVKAGYQVLLCDEKDQEELLDQALVPDEDSLKTL